MSEKSCSYKMQENYSLKNKGREVNELDRVVFVRVYMKRSASFTVICFSFDQGSTSQNGSGAVTCCQVLSLLPFQERDVGNKKPV